MRALIIVRTRAPRTFTRSKTSNAPSIFCSQKTLYTKINCTPNLEELKTANSPNKTFRLPAKSVSNIVSKSAELSEVVSASNTTTYLHPNTLR